MNSLKFDDLVLATGATPRQIRYLIAEGFVPPPTGGRTYAAYAPVHVAAIHRYNRLRSLGFPPAAIRLLLDAREGIPVPIIPGLTLVIAPDLLGSRDDAAEVGAEVARKVEELIAKDMGRGERNGTR